MKEDESGGYQNSGSHANTGYVHAKSVECQRACDRRDIWQHCECLVQYPLIDIGYLPLSGVGSAGHTGAGPPLNMPISICEREIVGVGMALLEICRKIAVEA